MGLTESLALEGYPLGIRVNALCPGPTTGPTCHDSFPGQDQNRLRTAGEVARAALFLFTDAVRHVHKQTREGHS
jgi:NAD(P)-dependent dehydrogenase (short-subunit alcohol dehydrogenase family)